MCAISKGMIYDLPCSYFVILSVTRAYSLHVNFAS